MPASKSLFFVMSMIVYKLKTHVEILSVFNYSHPGRPRCIRHRQMR